MYKLIADLPDFLLINKSPGVHFHSQDGSAGVAARLEQDINQKLYPVHRLDSVTSGLLLFAKSSSVANTFAELFYQHQVQKYYLAVAQGKPKKKQGSVIGDMAKSRRSQYKLLRSRTNPAITQFFSHSIAQGQRLYLLKPLSGKTHQLRVAMASLGVPILGDKLYGGAISDRTYLHAYMMAFEYAGEKYQFCAPLETGEMFRCDNVIKQVADWQAPQNLVWPNRS